MALSLTFFCIFAILPNNIDIRRFFMVQSSQQETLDELDIALLRTLQQDGRLSNVDLARTINLSSPATHTRLRRLEQQGYIRQYTALLNGEKVGYDLLCFVLVSLQILQSEQLEESHEMIRRLPEVLECHYITGDYDYLLKVVMRNRQDLAHFVMKRLTSIPGVARVQTCVVLSEIKSTTVLPLEANS
jgi:Lrp/AsnC family leucine-responsive transcriptional regulator